MSATGIAAGPGTAVPLSPTAVAGEPRWRRVFPGEERELREVRRWLATLLPDRPERDDVVSVATELSGNAILHTASGQGGWFTVEITRSGPTIRVAVADWGAPTGPRVVDDPTGEDGRGLLVVQGLSSRLGVCGDHRGRVVWADAPVPDAGTHGP